MATFQVTMCSLSECWKSDGKGENIDKYQLHCYIVLVIVVNTLVSQLLS